MPDFKAVVFAEGQLPGCNAFSRKIGLWRAVLGHVFSYNVLCRKIYPTLLGPRTYVHYRFSIISAWPAGLPNRWDHGSSSQNRPRLSVSNLWLLEKKHFYTWCAGLKVHALLTIYILDGLSLKTISCYCPFKWSGSISKSIFGVNWSLFEK